MYVTKNLVLEVRGIRARATRHLTGAPRSRSLNLAAAAAAFSAVLLLLCSGCFSKRGKLNKPDENKSWASSMLYWLLAVFKSGVSVVKPPLTPRTPGAD